ncbi:MAG: PAS domain-containing protein [Alphaproteobacteria bacterium]|nr:PAS domain-containing protein [Alphaproteobacteria bacterium]
MSFEEFLADIQSPELRTIALHWNAARGSKKMPGWKDLDPSAIAPHLRIVWSWKYDRSTDSFVGRLAGEDIIAVFEEDPRGKRMEDFFRNRQYDMVFARHKRVVAEPAFAHGVGQVFIHAKRYGQGERIIMPLAADGVHGDGIFGATIYTIAANAPYNPAAKRELVAEKVDFFALD